MQENDGGRIWTPCLAVENLVAIDSGIAVMHSGHERSSSQRMNDWVV